MSGSKTPFPIDYPPGATPLDPNELNGLLADYVATQGELNLLEQANILSARVWFTGRRQPDPLTDTMMLDLHRRMFNRVWSWAGKYRLSDKSIGVAWQAIPTEIAKLLADSKFWISNATYRWDELGARFHHRLVSIHAFPNGNGRHARLMTDLVLEAHGQAPFTWGASSMQGAIDAAGDLRSRYIEALRAADRRQCEPLVQFVRG